MTTLAPTTQFPEPFAFANETAPLRPSTPLLTPRDEARLQLLAIDIARYAPRLALHLRNDGLARLRALFIEA